MKKYIFLPLLLINFYGCSQVIEDKELKSVTPTLTMIRQMNFKRYDTTFTLKNLGDFIGDNSPVVKNFWATWCSPCLKEIPHLTETYRAYRSRGLRIVGLTTEDPSTATEKVKKMLYKFNVEYPVLFIDDSVYKYITAENDKAFSRLFVYSKAGELAARFGKWYGKKSIKVQKEAIKAVIDTR